MAKEHFFQVKVEWKKDRLGALSSNVLNETIQVATPPEFKKGIEGIWSPEHYFVAAINSCLMTTFLSIAENSKLDFINFESDAEGKLEIVGKKFMMSEVVLKPKVTIRDSKYEDKVLKVLEKAESACLISNSVKSKVSMEITIDVA